MEEKFYERIEGYHSINSVSSSLISKVYVWMTLALAITGVTAYGVATTPTLFMTMGKMMWGLIIALTLYLDFINLFLYLLKIFGNKK